MDTHPEEIAGKFVTRLQNGDVLEASQLLHDDVVWDQPGHSQFSGVHAGKPQVLKLLAGFAAIGVTIEFQEAYWCDDEVLCRVLIKHELGDRAEFQLLSLKDGMISRVRHHGDTDYLSMISSFGAEHPQAAS
ncbi:MAG: nuclear transport factor 2 family protein [Pseudomonadota bacterium]